MVRPRMKEHLRVCGAVFRPGNGRNLNKGTSPRVRSGPDVAGMAEFRLGNISACAERSVGGGVIGDVEREHLRVCGAVKPVEMVSQSPPGTSPRVRSGQLYFIGIWAGWMAWNV